MIPPDGVLAEDFDKACAAAAMLVNATQERCGTRLMQVELVPSVGDGPVDIGFLVRDIVAAAAPFLLAGARAENERHQKANLLRAVLHGWGETDDRINEAINAEGFDRVPWLIAQQALAERDAARQDAEKLRPLVFVLKQIEQMQTLAAVHIAAAVALDHLAALDAGGEKERGAKLRPITSIDVEDASEYKRPEGSR